MKELSFLEKQSKLERVHFYNSSKRLKIANGNWNSDFYESLIKLTDQASEAHIEHSSREQSAKSPPKQFSSKSGPISWCFVMGSSAYITTKTAVGKRLTYGFNCTSTICTFLVGRVYLHLSAGKVIWPSATSFPRSRWAYDVGRQFIVRDLPEKISGRFFVRPTSRRSMQQAFNTVINPRYHTSDKITSCASNEFYL